MAPTDVSKGTLIWQSQEQKLCFISLASGKNENIYYTKSSLPRWFSQHFQLHFKINLGLAGICENKEFSTYVRLAVKIAQLLKDKFCANILGRINILIPLPLSFFFRCLVFIQLDHSVKECFTQQLSGPRSPHLQHPLIPAHH